MSKALKSALNNKKSEDKRDHVHGQCENCGSDYKFRTKISKLATVSCPHCKKQSENWDTVGDSQMAPSVVNIRK